MKKLEGESKKEDEDLMKPVGIRRTQSTKILDLAKQNSELKREIEFISKCKNCSKSTTTERQLFRLVFI